MMKPIRLFVPLNAVLFLFGCSVTGYPESSGLLRQLHPYGGDDQIEKMDSAESKLRMIVTESESRMEILTYIDSMLAKRWLSHKNQIRVAMALGIVANVDNLADEEIRHIVDIIRNGKNHSDFYGMILSLRQLPRRVDEFTELKIEALQEDREIIAKIFNPDGGGRAKYCVQDEVLYDLRRITGQSFGRDYQAWRDWWEAEASKPPHSSIESGGAVESGEEPAAGSD